MMAIQFFRPSRNLGCWGFRIGRFYADMAFPQIFVAWNLVKHGAEYSQFAFRFWFWWTGFRGEVYHPATPEMEATVTYPKSKGLWKRLRRRVVNRLPLPNFIYQRFSRRSWTANPADPTQVIEWRWRAQARHPFRHDRLVLLASWAVEARITLFGRRWTAYDVPFYTWLFDALEDRYHEELSQFDDDPMGRLADYE